MSLQLQKRAKKGKKGKASFLKVYERYTSHIKATNFSSDFPFTILIHLDDYENLQLMGSKPCIHLVNILVYPFRFTLCSQYTCLLCSTANVFEHKSKTSRRINWENCIKIAQFILLAFKIETATNVCFLSARSKKISSYLKYTHIQVNTRQLLNAVIPQHIPE